MMRLALDMVRVLSVLPLVEHGFRRRGPRDLLPRLRARGRTAPRRDPVERQRLRRAISVVDRLLPGRRSCYRRALLEIALDPDAVAESLVIGLSLDGDQVRGHAWIDGRDDPSDGSDRYDFTAKL